MSYRLVAASLSLFFTTLLPCDSIVAQDRGGPRSGRASISPSPYSNTRGTEISSGRISGTVRTIDGRGVQNAEIEARAIEGENLSATTRSDSSGSFALYNISPGTYEVTVRTGVNEARERVHVDSTFSEANVSFQLANKVSAGDRTARNASIVSLPQYRVPAKARSLYEKAAQFMAHGKFDQSLDKVNAALALCPQFSEALTLRGILEENAGKKNEAIADYQQAIQFDSNYPVAYLALAATFNSTGRFDESLLLLVQAERLAPNAWQVYFESARANIGKGDFAAALRNVERASGFKGGSQKELPELHLLRGYALIGLGQIPKAIEELQAFLARVPSGQLAQNARNILDRLRVQSITASRSIN